MRSTGPEQSPEQFPWSGWQSPDDACIGPFETAACWYDLLGFSAALDASQWRLDGPQVAMLVKRLHNLCNQLATYGASHEQLVVNDGVISTFSPDIYEAEYGSRHDVIQWLHRCLKVHCITTGIEHDFQLPGLRSVLCQGEIIVHYRGGEPQSAEAAGDLFPMSMQFNTALAKCFVADKAGSRAGMERGGVYVDTELLATMQNRFGCTAWGDFLFLYGTPLLFPVERYVELTDYYQLPSADLERFGLASDRSCWLQLGKAVSARHGALDVTLRQIVAFSPFDESALFWFDTLTGDMHGVGDDGVIVLDDSGQPRHPNPPVGDREARLFSDFRAAYDAFVEKHGCAPHNVEAVQGEPREVVAVKEGDHYARYERTPSGLLVPLRFRRRLAPGRHPWSQALLAGRELRKALGGKDVSG